MDASIMDGSTMQAGAVASVGGIRHPVQLARFPFSSKHLKGWFGPRVSNGNVFGPKEVGLGPVLVTVTFLDQRRSVGTLCW